MARPPLEVGTYGEINTVEITPGRCFAETRFRMANGRAKRVRRYSKTKAAAERALKKRLKILADEVTGGAINGDTRMEKVIGLWVKEIEREAEKEVIARSTVRMYKGYVKNWVLPALGELLAREAEESVTTFDNLIKKAHDERSYEAAKSVRAVLSGICAYAIRNKAMRTNPVKSTARLVAGSKKEVKALTVEQRADLKAKLIEFGKKRQTDKQGRSLGKRGRVWLLLPSIMDCMLATGVRIGELLALMPEDVDLGNRRVKVGHHIVRLDGGLVREELRKGGEEGLDLKVPEWSVPTWRNLILQSGGGPVFASNRGAWWGTDAIVDRLKEAFTEVGYGWVTSHVWRKTVADVLKEAGLPTTMIADQLGNTVAVVERHYRKRYAANDTQAQALEGMHGEDKTG